MCLVLLVYITHQSASYRLTMSPLVSVPSKLDRFSTRKSADTIPTHIPRRGSTDITNTKKLMNRVHFDHKQEVFPIISRNDYTDKEFDNCWSNNPKDKARKYKEFQRDVKRMLSGKKPKEDCTFRGLEQYTEKNSDQIIYDCIDAVMDEQERQCRDPDTFDWDRFRQVSLTPNRRQILPWTWAISMPVKPMKLTLQWAEKSWNLKMMTHRWKVTNLTKYLRFQTR